MAYNTFDDAPTPSRIATERAEYEPDGLPVMWAALERKFLMVMTSARYGRAGKRVPKALVERQRIAARNRAKRTCTGVAWHKPTGKWWAYRPLANGGRHSLGYHKTREEAERAVKDDASRRKAAA